MTHERAKELVVANREGRVLILPCKVGSKVYHLYHGCDFPGECGAKRTCTGCEYRKDFIEELAFCLSMLSKSVRLEPPYFLTREEAEKAREEKHGNK